MRIQNPPNFKRMAAHLVIGCVIAAIEYGVFQRLGFDQTIAFSLSFLFLVFLLVIAVLKETFFS